MAGSRRQGAILRVAANVCALADLKMNRLLAASTSGWRTTGWQDGRPAERYAATDVGAAPRLGLWTCARIRTVVWATGFRPDYSWLDVPVFDRKGRSGTIAASSLRQGCMCWAALHAPAQVVLHRRRSRGCARSCRSHGRSPLPRRGLTEPCVNAFADHYDVVIVGARCAGARDGASPGASRREGARGGAAAARLRHDLDACPDAWRRCCSFGAGVFFRCSPHRARRRSGPRPFITEAKASALPSSRNRGSRTSRAAPDASRRASLDAAEAAGADVRHGMLLSGLQFNSRGRVVGAWLTHPTWRASRQRRG